jgi:hypothetical protein
LYKEYNLDFDMIGLIYPIKIIIEFLENVRMNDSIELIFGSINSSS